VLSAQRFQLGRPAGGRDLEHRIGPETGDHPPFPPDSRMARWWSSRSLALSVVADLDREALEQRPRPNSGEVSFSVIRHRSRRSHARQPVGTPRPRAVVIEPRAAGVPGTGSSDREPLHTLHGSVSTGAPSRAECQRLERDAAGVQEAQDVMSAERSAPRAPGRLVRARICGSM